MIEKGFESYEISNYAKPGFRSRHNSAYWQFVPYLGLGPSAHSFDGKSRQWNIASVQKYIQSISILKPSFEKEVLSEQDFYNDFIMVSLRTKEGIDLIRLKNRFGDVLFDYCLQNAENQIKYGNLILNNNRLFLSDAGVHITNQVIVELMKTD